MISLFPDWFYLNTNSIASLAQLILAGVITGILLRNRNKSKATWCLTIFFATCAGFCATGFIKYSCLYDWGEIYGDPLQANILLLESIALLQFAYNFPSPSPKHEKEAKGIFVCSSCIFLFGLYFTVRYIQTQNSLFYLILFALVGAEYLGVILILSRRVIHLTDDYAPKYGGGRHRNTDRGNGITAILRQAWRLFLHPTDRPIYAMREFILVISILCILTLWAIVYWGILFPNLSEAIYDISLNLGILLFFFLFILVYLNYSPESNSFMNKLMLSTLVTVLCIAGTMGQISMSAFEDEYDYARLSDVSFVDERIFDINRKPEFALAPLPPSIAFIISRSSFSSSGASDAVGQKTDYVEHFSRNVPLDIDFINATGDPKDEINKVFRDDSGRKITRKWRLIEPQNPNYYFTYNFIRNARQYEVGFPVTAYGSYCNRKALSLVYILLGSSSVALLIFPTFFRISLVKPLDTLLEGVRKIDRGSLDIVVPIQYNDEIGFITKSFNGMAAQLHDLVHSLEQRVQERTQRLASANEQLRKESIERQRAREIAEAANKKILASIRYARMIQNSLLPSIPQIQQHLPESFFIWMPRDIVSGYVFCVEWCEEGVLIVLMDCTGHGIPGAFMTMIASSGVRRIVKDGACYDPAIILRRLNGIIKKTLHQDTEYAQSDDGLDAAACFIHTEKRLLTFAGARLSLYVAQDGNVSAIKGDRQSLGYKRSDIHFPFTLQTIQIHPDMTFYLTTDGFIDQFGGESGMSFGKKRLKALLQKQYSVPFAQQRDNIMQAFDAYKGDRHQVDDVTFIGFTINGSSKESILDKKSALIT